MIFKNDSDVFVPNSKGLIDQLYKFQSEEDDKIILKGNRKFLVKFYLTGALILGGISYSIYQTNFITNHISNYVENIFTYNEKTTSNLKGLEKNLNKNSY